MPVYWNLDIFTGCSMTFFAFQCQVQLLPIYSELVQPEYRRISKVIDRAIIVDVAFYMVVAIAGYLSDFNKTATLVLERQTFNGTDYAALIGIIGVIISISVAFPCAYNPARAQVVNMIYGKDEFSNGQNTLISVLWVASSWGLSVAFPHIDLVQTIAGGLCASTLDYFLPMYCFVVLSKDHWTAPKNLLCIVAFGSMTMIGYISIGVAVFEAVTGCETMRQYAEDPDKCAR